MRGPGWKQGSAALRLMVPALLAGCAGHSGGQGSAQPPASLSTLDAAQCAALAQPNGNDSPVAGLTVTAASWQAAGTTVSSRGVTSAPLPAHCLVEGYYGTRVGTVGGPYRTGFRMRLPAAWNTRFFFNGGGGSNGTVADASGFNGAGTRLCRYRAGQRA
jgi:hypothetical protein